jgi:DNA-binding transcriptional regulator GbsR (MarR family)
LTGKSAGPTLARRPKRPKFIQIEINCSFLLEHFGPFCFNRPRMPGATATVSDASAEFSPGASLSAIEVEVIDLFVSIMRLIGLPRSLGEIYGLLFISTLPLTLDDLVSRLQISKGSASQGLKTLRQIGAVKVTYVPGDRRDHFIAETELKRLAAGFINGQMLPHLETGKARLVRMRELEKQVAGKRNSGFSNVHRDRIDKLEHWHRRARALAPLVGKFLD